MKKVIFLVLFLQFGSYYVFGQVATSVSVLDTRSQNLAPLNYAREVKFEFKERGVVGLPGVALYGGMLTLAPWSDNSGGVHHQLGFIDQSIYYRNGLPQSATWGQWVQVLMANSAGNVGIGTANPSGNLEILGQGSTTQLVIKHQNESQPGWGLRLSQRSDLSSTIESWGNDLIISSGWDKKVVIGTVEFNNFDGKVVFPGGNIGIGTTNPAFKLDVIGTVRAREVRVDMSGADFVFEPGYSLMPLSELKSYVQTNRHLPEIQPAAEMQASGVEIGALTNQLLQKIEELTLHVIHLNEELELLKKKGNKD